MATPPFEMGTCGGATGLGINVEYCKPLGAVLEHCKIKQSSQKYVTCIKKFKLQWNESIDYIF